MRNLISIFFTTSHVLIEYKLCVLHVRVEQKNFWKEYG